MNLSTKHNNHQVYIAPGKGPHYRALRCLDCDKHIMWLTEKQVSAISSVVVGVTA